MKKRLWTALGCIFLLVVLLDAQTARIVPDEEPASRLRPMIEQFGEDLGAFHRLKNRARHGRIDDRGRPAGLRKNSGAGKYALRGSHGYAKILC